MWFHLRTSTRASIVYQLLSVHCVIGFLNLSLNKTADMSSRQYSDSWLAVEAVDGDITQKVEQGSCAVTSDNFHKQAWWRVDLGEVYVLNSVKIYYRKENEDPMDSFTYHLSGFSIYVADTLNWWIGTRCYLHNNGEHTNPGPSDILTVPCNATGRYVTVYKQRNDTCRWNVLPFYKQYCSNLELCEVQVLGCEDGTYGESCSNNCSGNCLYGGHCNKAHGGCDDGCAPGYRGFYCKEECNFGSFGYICSNQCGECNNDTCNHINGTCPRGCNPGWVGSHCNEQRQILNEDEDENDIVIIISVICVLLITSLTGALLFTCIRLRNQQHLNMKNSTNSTMINRRGPIPNIYRDTIQDTVVNQETEDDIRIGDMYEDLESTTTDINTYDLLQRERNGTSEISEFA